jgi:hypothetical protein
MALSEITKEVLKQQPIVVDTNYVDKEWREHQHYFGISESTLIGFQWKEVVLKETKATYFNPYESEVEYLVDAIYLSYWDGEQEELTEEDEEFIKQQITFK